MATESFLRTPAFVPGQAHPHRPTRFPEQALPQSPDFLRRSAGVLRRAVSLSLLFALAACSTDVLAPPERTGSVGPMTRPAEAEMRQDRLAAYPPASMRASTRAPGAGSMPPLRDDAALSQTSPIPPQGVDIDAMVSGGPVVGLAEEQSREIAEGRSAMPVVDGIGTNGVHALPVPGQSVTRPQDAAASGADPDLPLLTPDARAAEARRQAQFLDQERRVTRPRRDGSGASARTEEQQVAFLPRAVDPLSEPSSSGGRMPASEIACRQRLTRLGVTFADVPAISSGPSCGIDHPLSLSGLTGGISVRPAVKLNCEVTEAFALWVRNELAPAARLRYLSGIGTIKPLGGYSCRTMNSRRGAAMSEHAHGNAIDVGTFVLKNGKAIDVRKPGFFAFREKGLLKAVRQDSCRYFNTVLGPGSDPYHKDHFHFDLRDRKSGYRHCS